MGVLIAGDENHARIESSLDLKKAPSGPMMFPDVVEHCIALAKRAQAA
jgi:hypothetical protein